MKLLTSAFEIGYSPSFKLLDQSPLYLDGVIGSPSFFTNILPRLARRLSDDQMHALMQTSEMYKRVEQWVTEAVTGAAYQAGSVECTVAWERVRPRAGVFSIHAAEQVASVSLLICRDHENDLDEQPWSENVPLWAFMRLLKRVMPANQDPIDHRTFQPVTMTRRPLLASVFWPPYTPIDDSVVRTIQLQMAYAFFRLTGELPL